MKITRLKITVITLSLVLLVKIIITLVALPKASIDYVAQYNDLTKPVNFVPEENAADYYQKAVELHIRYPNSLSNSSPMCKWTDGKITIDELPPESIKQLEDWVASNKPSVEQVKLALQKPYCWFERESDNGSTMNITYLETSSVESVAEVLLYSAKLNAFKKDFISATDDIVDSYRIGQHLCRENLSRIEQSIGISIKENATKAMLGILSYSTPKAEELKYLQDSFQPIIENDKYIPGCSLEKLFQYDILQRVYLDWVLGINKPAFRVVYGIRCMCGDNNFLWVQAFVGPSRNKVVHQIDKVVGLYEQLCDKTPWQIEHQYKKQEDEIREIHQSNFFMKMFGFCYFSLFTHFQEANAQADALIIALAILRFEADNNRLPEALDELVSMGYIKNLPQDPYSESTLVYKIAGADFKLYSIDRDFKDNGGEPITIELNAAGMLSGMPGPLGMSPSPEVIKTEITDYKDIIYWPEQKTPSRYSPIGLQR